MEANAKPISVGDRVRSYDFPTSEESYVEGVVEEIDVTHSPGGVRFDCPRYAIRVEREVWGGSPFEGSGKVDQLVFPPMNGTPIAGRDKAVTDYVRRIEPEVEPHMESRGARFEVEALERRIEGWATDGVVEGLSLSDAKTAAHYLRSVADLLARIERREREVGAARASAAEAHRLAALPTGNGSNPAAEWRERVERAAGQLLEHISNVEALTIAEAERFTTKEDGGDLAIHVGVDAIEKLVTTGRAAIVDGYLVPTHASAGRDA